MLKSLEQDSPAASRVLGQFKGGFFFPPHLWPAGVFRLSAEMAP